MPNLGSIMSIGAGSLKSASDFEGNMNTWDVALVTGGSSSSISSLKLTLPSTLADGDQQPIKNAGHQSRVQFDSRAERREEVTKNRLVGNGTDNIKNTETNISSGCGSESGCAAKSSGSGHTGDTSGTIRSVDFGTSESGSEDNMTTGIEDNLLFGFEDPMQDFDSAFNASFNDSLYSWNTSLHNESYIVLGMYPSGYNLPTIVFASIVVTLLMIVIVVGNILVIIAIATEKALKNIQNWFIASLAVADFFLGLIIMPFSLANEIMGYWIFGYLWCDIYSAMDVLLCTASIMNLCLISLDRFWSITQAVEYLKKRTPARAILMITMVWLLSALVCIPPLLGWKRPSPEEEYPKCKVGINF